MNGGKGMGIENKNDVLSKAVSEVEASKGYMRLQKLLMMQLSHRLMLLQNQRADMLKPLQAMVILMAQEFMPLHKIAI